MVVPTGVVTVTSTLPASPGGLVTSTSVRDCEKGLATAPRPKWTAVTPARLVPKICTDVPPPVDPNAGLMLVMTGVFHPR